MEGNKANLSREGEAIFLEWYGDPSLEADNLWELRQQTKTMLLAGQGPQRFVVTEVVNLRPGDVNAILGDMRTVASHLKIVQGNVSDEVDGVFSCVALWDMRLSEGALMHRSGVQWLVAALPIMDMGGAQREEQAATDLTTLAMKPTGISIRLNRTIEPVRYALSDLLDILSEQIDC